MAGTEDKITDTTEAPLFVNAKQLLEVEQKRSAIHSEKIDLENRADQVINVLGNNVPGLGVFASIMTIFLAPPKPFDTTFTYYPVFILFICVCFLGFIYILLDMTKSAFTRVNSIKPLRERHQKVRADARILMELEKNRTQRLAKTAVEDNSQGAVVDMDSFITRAKTIYDAADFSDFEKVYHKKIGMSWLFGILQAAALVVMGSAIYFR